MSDPHPAPNDCASSAMRRRTVLARLSTLALAMGLPAPLARVASADTPELAATPPAADRFGDLLPTRSFGRHDERVTTLCIGGSHFERTRSRWSNQAQAFADASIEQGVRFIDTAESYGRGRSETLIGETYVPQYRDELFIMTKTKGRTGDEVRAHLDGSRQRMNLDVIDLWQIHSLQDAADVDRFVDQGGLDAFLEARQRGTVRYLGMTGHVSPDPMNHLMDRLDERGVVFDAAQVPINLVDPGYESFLDKLVPRLVEQGYAVLAMKTLAYGQFFGQNNAWANRRQSDPATLVPDRVSLDEALQFVLAHPIASLVSGMDRIDHLEQNCKITREFAGMSAETRAELVERVAFAAGESMEFYKRPGVS